MGELKIYRHIRAQATIKVKIEGSPNPVMIKFRAGRVLSNADEQSLEVIGGRYVTTDPKEQAALEARADFKKNFYIDHNIDKGKKEVLPSEDQYIVFPEIDSLNGVKNTLKEHYPDDVEGKDFQSPESMLKACKRVGVAFPDFFEEQEHFKPKNTEVKSGDSGQGAGNGSGGGNDLEIEIDPEELMKMKRGDLDDFAAEVGVKNPETLSNKKAVVEEIKKLAQEQE